VPDPDRPRAWTLLLDGTPQSHVDLDDPVYLEFEYVRRLGHAVDLAAPPGRPLRVLHLGGGGLTLPRYVAATRPLSSQLVAEADAALTELVRRRLPLGRGRRAGRGGRDGGDERTGRLRVRISDAREVLAGVRESRFDMVIADVFAAGQTPAHLTSVEFTAAAARALAGDGLYAANVADGPPLAHSRAQVATVRAVFPEVCLIGDPAVLRDRRFGNLVVVAARRPLPVPELTRLAASDPYPARVVHGADLERFAAGAPPVTDATARPSPPAPPAMFATPRPLKISVEQK